MSAPERKQTTVKYTELPRKGGKLCVFPEIKYGKYPEIVIIGDPKGLLYLADVLKYVATIDQEKLGLPKGARAHIHLSPEKQIRWHSSPVTISRADASVSKESPEYMKD